MLVHKAGPCWHGWVLFDSVFHRCRSVFVDPASVSDFVHFLLWMNDVIRARKWLSRSKNACWAFRWICRLQNNDHRDFQSSLKTRLSWSDQGLHVIPRLAVLYRLPFEHWAWLRGRVVQQLLSTCLHVWIVSEAFGILYMTSSAIKFGILVEIKSPSSFGVDHGSTRGSSTPWWMPFAS